MSYTSRFLIGFLFLVGLNFSVFAQVPQITQHPSNTLKCNGDIAQLSVVATGAEPLTYQWFKDGAPVGTNSDILLFPALGASDIGLYLCNVSNGEGNIDSEIAEVMVVAAAPVVTDISTENSFVCIGTSNLFEVTFSGDYCSSTWYFETNTLGYGSSYNLTDANLSDEGDYFCVVENVCGEATSEFATIDIVEYALITTEPLSQTICEGEDAIFTATATGDYLNYMWLADDIMMPAETTISLTLSGLTVPHTTAYNLVAYNVCNYDTSSTVHVNVNNLPQITGQPINIEECLGTEVNLYAYADGTTEAEYQWFNLVEAIDGETNPSLSLNILPNDTAHYYCHISNICGYVNTDTVDIITKMPPEITQQPEGATLCVGDDITIQVKATGTAILYYQWLYNSSNVTGANISGDLTPNLTTNAINEGQAGLYSCHVHNECGFVVSETAELIVNTPPVVSEQPQDQEICEGLELTVNMNYQGTEPIDFEWYIEETNTLIGEDAIYTSDYADPAASGSYYCILTNSCAEISTDTVDILILALPQITTHPEDETVCEGDYAEMSVTATGAEPLDYLWYRNGSAVTSQTNSTLSYPSALINQTGEYFCRVSNVCAYDDSFYAYLEVGTEPAITWNPIDMTICEIDTLNLIMDVQGENYTLQWYFNDIPLSGENDTVLNIPNVASSFAGEYYCSAFNACATVSTDTVTVIINEAPELSLGDDIDLCDGETTTLTADGTYVHYDWNNGLSNQAFIDVHLGGTFILEVIGSNSCKNRDTVVVEFHPYHDILFNNEDIIACGPYSLNAGEGAYSYLWNNDLSSSSIPITSSGVYSVTVLGDSYGCETSQSVFVDVREAISFELGNDVSVPVNSYVDIGIEATFFQYVWNTGFEEAMLSVYGSTYGLGDHEFWLTAIAENGCTHTDTIIVNFWDNAGIGTINSQNKMSLYPNPATDYIFFEFNDINIKQIEIYNIIGEQIGTYKTNNDEFSLDVSDFAKGLYLIKAISIDNITITDKILIQ